MAVGRAEESQNVCINVIKIIKELGRTWKKRDMQSLLSKVSHGLVVRRRTSDSTTF